MDTLPQAQPPAPAFPRIRAFGVGNAGIHVLELFIRSGFSAEHAVAFDTVPITASSAPHKLQFASAPRGLSGGDPERGQAMAEEQAADIKGCCDGADVIFII